MGLIFVNGNEQSTISAIDRGVLYGDSLFETVAISNGKTLLLEQHLSRLEKGVDILGFDVDFSILKNEIAMFISFLQEKKRFVGNAVLRITLTRGEQSRGYRPLSNSLCTRILSVHDWPSSNKSAISVSISDVRYSHQPILAGLKHANRLEQVLAAQSIPEKMNDVVMLDINDCIISASKGNLFIKLDGVWLTPKLNRCGIEGVVRNYLCTWFSQNGFSIKQDNIHIDMIMQQSDKVEAAFLCNSIVGVLPIKQFAGIDIDSESVCQNIIDDLIEHEVITA